MEPAEAAKYCETVGAKSALPRIIKTGYHALQLVHFFTAGEDEVRAWSVKKDTPAPAAAGVIHTDFCKSKLLQERSASDVRHGCNAHPDRRLHVLVLSSSFWLCY
jgi:obg-like ATPase 1